MNLVGLFLVLFGFAGICFLIHVGRLICAFYGRVKGIVLPMFVCLTLVIAGAMIVWGKCFE